jgi:predicted nucleotidyltransferase
MNNEVEFIEKFTRAFNASRPTNPPKGDSNQGKDPISNIYFSTLYSRSCKLISNSRGIISQFEDANEKTTKTQVAGAFHSRWKDENKSVIQMVAIGHKYGLERMEAMLEGKELPVVEEEDKLFVDAIYDKGLDDGMVPWGKLAKRQLKAGKRLYKTALMPEGGS